MNTNITLNPMQLYAYNVMMAGHNTFLTGDGGVGKTSTLNKFIEASTAKGFNVMVTAMTGIASLNLGGVTAHKALEIPIGPLTYMRDNYDPSDEIIQSDIIIIDEISMCRIDTFDFISNKILKANNIRKRVGKHCIQLIVVGDFFQLPPVTLPYEKAALNKFYGTDIGVGFAFESRNWKLFNFVNVILTDVVRQSNIEFIQSLNKVRTGDKTEIDNIVKKSNTNYISDGITLCGTRNEADRMNIEALEKLPGQLVEYPAEFEGDIENSGLNIDEKLELKVGARVMTLINKGPVNNGSLGTVIELKENSVLVLMDSGVKVECSRYEWTVYDYELQRDEEADRVALHKHSVGLIRQFPLKLAYAITIHKSQGQTYKKVNISPYCWDCGQLYVALSRVESLENLHFNYAPDPRYLIISLNVIKFYNSIVSIANPNIDITPREPSNIILKSKAGTENDMRALLDML